MRFEKYQFQTFQDTAQAAALAASVRLIEEPPAVILTDELADEIRRQALEEGQSAGFHDGVEHGRVQTLEEAEKKIAAAVEAAVAQAVTDHHKQLEMTMGILSQSLADGLRLLREEQAAHQSEMADVVLALAQKLAGAALENAPLPTIREHITRSLGTLHHEPEAEIRVAPACVEDVQKMSKECAEKAEFRGTIRVEGDSLLKAGDCRVAWQQGSSERRLETLLEAMEPLIQKYFVSTQKDIDHG